MIVGRMRSSILTEGNTGDLRKVVVQELNGIALKQRERLDTIESELAHVHRRLGQLWEIVDTTDDVPDSTGARVKANSERQKHHGVSAKEATAILSHREVIQDEVGPSRPTPGARLSF